MDHVLVFTLMLVITSRGVLEVLVDKQLAYVFQFACAALLVLYLRGRSIVVPGTRRWGNYVATYALLLAGLLSTAITQNIWGLSSLEAPLLYVLTTCAVGVLLCLGSDADRVSHMLRCAAPAAVVVVALQVGAALAQQYLQWLMLPGSDFGSFGGHARPSGMTGSYLHYPLVLGILAVILVGAWARTRRASYAIGVALALLGIFVSLSRSGMMIVALTLVFAVFLGRTIATRIVIAVCVGYAALIALLLFPDNPIVARGLSALDLESAGNVGRIDQWSDGIRMWLDSPLVFGGYTGLVTNVGRNFGLTAIGIVESSLLQQLLNVGLVGAVATYWLLFAVVRAIPKHDMWVRAGLLACVLQTLIYQSIEVLPFMAIIAVIPLIFTHEWSSTSFELPERKRIG